MNTCQAGMSVLNQWRWRTHPLFLKSISRLIIAYDILPGITRLVQREIFKLKIRGFQKGKGGFNSIQVLTSCHCGFLLCNIRDINSSSISDKVMHKGPFTVSVEFSVSVSVTLISMLLASCSLWMVLLKSIVSKESVTLIPTQMLTLTLTVNRP